MPNTEDILKQKAEQKLRDALAKETAPENEATEPPSPSKPKDNDNSNLTQQSAIMTGVVVGCLIFILYFLLAPRQVRLFVEPETVKVSYDNQLICESSPCLIRNLPIWPGKIEIEADNYQTQPVKIKLSEHILRANPDIHVQLHGIAGFPIAPASGPCAESIEDRRIIGQREAVLCDTINPMVVLPVPDRYGTCRATYSISAEGYPADINISSCSNLEFDPIAYQSIERRRYKPALYFGRPIETPYVEVSIEYNKDLKPAPTEERPMSDLPSKTDVERVSNKADLSQVDLKGVNACGEARSNYRKIGIREAQLCADPLKNLNRVSASYGVCEIRFSVNSLGFTEDSEAYSCDWEHIQTAEKIVSERRYRPALFNSRAILSRHNETMIFGSSSKPYRPSGNGDAEVQSCPDLPPPPKAKRSGYCDLIFDISTTGEVKNIKREKCTDEVFYSVSKTVLKSCQIKPAITDGVAVDRPHFKHKIRFRVFDSNGYFISEPTD